MVSGTFVSGNRCVGLNQYHMEWAPKYRKAIMVDGVKVAIEQSFVQTSQLYKISIHAMEVDDDHVHLFVSIPFDMSASKALQLLKGRSAYDVFRTFPWLREQFKKGHFWSPGKFCRSISNVTSGAIYGYIRGHQGRKLNETILAAKMEIDQLRLSSFF